MTAYHLEPFAAPLVDGGVFVPPLPLKAIPLLYAPPRSGTPGSGVPFVAGRKAGEAAGLPFGATGMAAGDGVVPASAAFFASDFSLHPPPALAATRPVGLGSAIAAGRR